MKRTFLYFVIAFFLGISNSYSQIDEIGKFLAGGVDDAEELANGYLAPYFNAFGASLTGGWYNTAKPHQLGGFDITATFNTAIVPNSDKTFDLSELTLGTLKLAPGADNTTPTIAGENSTGSRLNYNTGNSLPEVEAFDMPPGTGWAYIPSPMLQMGVGLIKDTEIIGRYMPTYNRDDAKIGMWGIGFKHGLKQWIPFIKKVPILHLTVHYGYTKLNSSIGIDVTPGDIGAEDLTNGVVSWEDQKMDFVTQSHTGNLLVSANLPIVCFYGGIGFATTKTNFKLLGNYPSISATNIAAGNIVVDENSFLADPINTEFKNSDGSATKPRFNAGVRFKFAIVTLHFDYTYANYSMATAGLGISFR